MSVKPPTCIHPSGPPVGCMCWPRHEDYVPGLPHASVYVCALESCQADARAWVRSITDHDGVLITFEEDNRGVS